MTWALVQDAMSIDDSANASPTQVATFAAAAGVGALVVVTIAWGQSGGGAPGPVTVADTLGNIYSACGPAYQDATNGQYVQTFCAVNISAASIPTITATFDVARNFKRMGIAEFTGNADANPFDQANGQLQAAPGTGTDAVSSDVITPSQSGCLIYGWTNATDSTDPGTGQISPGSGFQATEGDDATPDIFMGEWYEQPIALPVAATFTLSIAHRMLTSVASFLPAPDAAPDIIRRNDRTSVPPQVRLG